MSRRKYSKEFKLKVLAEHEEKGLSFWKLGKNYGIEASIIRRWWHAFDAYGEKGLEKHNSDLCNFSAEFKEMVIAFIYYEGFPEEKNLITLLDLLNESETREDDETYKNPADMLFDELEEREPEHFA